MRHEDNEIITMSDLASGVRTREIGIVELAELELVDSNRMDEAMRASVEGKLLWYQLSWIAQENKGRGMITCFTIPSMRLEDDFDKLDRLTSDIPTNSTVELSCFTGEHAGKLLELYSIFDDTADGATIVKLASHISLIAGIEHPMQTLFDLIHDKENECNVARWIKA